jgi:hypothetical protein
LPFFGRSDGLGRSIKALRKTLGWKKRTLLGVEKGCNKVILVDLTLFYPVLHRFDYLRSARKRRKTPMKQVVAEVRTKVRTR